MTDAEGASNDSSVKWAAGVLLQPAVKENPYLKPKQIHTHHSVAANHIFHHKYVQHTT